MPSKSVSFSDEGYIQIIQEKPDDMGFSEWVETISLEGIEHMNESGESGQQSTEA